MLIWVKTMKSGGKLRERRKIRSPFRKFGEYRVPPPKMRKNRGILLSILGEVPGLGPQYAFLSQIPLGA
jgi:hypothetical protein